MEYESPRRIVVWADGTADEARAAGWAAAHAAARALPLHLVHVAAAGEVAEAGHAGAGGAAFASRNQTAMDMVRLAQDARRIRGLYPGLAVTAETVEDGEDGEPFPPQPSGEPGDLLVTGTFGFLRLVPGDGDGAAREQMPVVVIPDAPPGEAHGAPRRRLLLLTGPQLSPDTAAFAFATAADLGASLDAVRVDPQDGAFGDDYWIDAGRSAYRAESRLQNELAKLRARFPTVPGVAVTLRTRPWATLRTMACSTHLAVVGGGPDAGRDLKVLLELAVCPVAVCPAQVPGALRTASR